MTNISKMNGAILVLFLCTIKTTQSYINCLVPPIEATNARSSGGASDQSTTISRSFVSAEAVIVGVGPLYSSPTDYFGEPEIRSSFVIKEFSNQQDLKDIIKLASNPLPSRPDGIVTVAKYTSATREPCIATEGQYETLARANPASLFLRCFAEYKDADVLLSSAKVSLTALPIYDVFYGGERVARVEGNNIAAVEEMLNSYQFLNSKLDLFSEDADNKRRLAWEEGKLRKTGEVTPRTTAAFIPGYDWNLEGGAFDEAAKKAEESFEDTYGDWLPNINDE